ncbi:MAG: hypothetical protein ACYC6M_02215 [Terriglobales bacterium]
MRWRLLFLVMVMASAVPPAGAMTVRWERPWVADRTLMTQLRDTGDSVVRPNATLWFDHDALAPAQREEFADLVSRGITDIATWLGTKPTRRKLCYFVSEQVDISHSRFGCVFLPLSRVRRRAAPYLHETTHLLVKCDQCPVWFSEGFASYLESEIAAHVGGYDGAIFTHHGNTGVDRDAAHWLKTPEGQAVIAYIGQDAEPADMSWNRGAVATPFYVFAQSFVNFLAIHAGHDALRRLVQASEFDPSVNRETGASVATWKRRWLASLTGARPARKTH